MGIKAFKLLFRSSDQICVGNEYATEVGPQPLEPRSSFFSINPLSSQFDYQKSATGLIERNNGSRRADLNVTRFQNFLAEIDNIPVQDQLELLKKSDFPWATITYSGGKSLHAILSLETPLDIEPHTQEGVDFYKKTWKQLASVFEQRIGLSNVLDSSCQNPSRLSRMPGAYRNGIEQKLLYLGRLCSNHELNEILKECTDIKDTKISKLKNVTSLSEKDIKLYIPAELFARLRFPASWSQGESGNYPHIFKLALWLHDSTGCDFDTAIQFFEKYTFPGLRRMGYPDHRMKKAVEDAFRSKGVL
jgi:hypothetical protein